MALAKLINDYIVYKQSLGRSFRTPSVRLRAFLAEVGDVEPAEITPKQVRKFLDGNHGPESTYWFCKYTALSTFFRYAIDRSLVKQSPVPKTLPKKPETSAPYIYSVTEVKRLLDAADTRHQDDWLLEPATVRAMILLLYGTGLRIGEATRLRLSDVDLDEQLLTVRETKFYKSRLVPFCDDLAEAMRRYRDYQWKTSNPIEESTFLSCRSRQPIKNQTAQLVFKRLRSEAGVFRNDGAKFQPRLHDFRHTFAVTRLVTWYREGENVQRLLPHLSTYLGHGRLQDTTRYLRMTHELMQEANQWFEQYAFGESCERQADG